MEERPDWEQWQAGRKRHGDCLIKRGTHFEKECLSSICGPSVWDEPRPAIPTDRRTLQGAATIHHTQSGSSAFADRKTAGGPNQSCRRSTCVIFLLGKVVLYIPISLGITEHLPRTAGAIINADVNPVSFTVVGSKSESVNICWRHRQPRAELCAGTLRSYGESWPPLYHTGPESTVWNGIVMLPRQSLLSVQTIMWPSSEVYTPV